MASEPYALNTNVNGSSGTCTEAADWLRKLHREAGEAANLVGRGRTTAEGGWHGPARERFSDVTAGLAPHLDDITEVASRYERALRDFAGALDVINTKMDSALAKAKAGGLRVQGPFILGPERPQPPAQMVLPGQRPAQLEEYLLDRDAARDRYNAVLVDYNAKVAVYKTCKSIVDGARNQEENAHLELRQAMGQSADPEQHMVRGAFTILSTVRSTVGGMENPRRLHAATAERLLTQARFLNDFALGAVAGTNPAQARILDRAAKLAADGGKHLTRAQQFGKWVNIVPEEVRQKITAYPGQKAAERLATHSKSASVPALAARTARAVPYVGAVLTAGNEIVGAATGEQTWDRAAANTGATIVGGALGGAAVGAAAGSAFTPVGSLVLGLAGGIGGAIFAQDVVTGIYGDEK